MTISDALIAVEPEMLANKYKHVSHWDVVKLFDRARIEFFHSVGLPDYDGFWESGSLMIVGKIDIQYKREFVEPKVRFRINGIELRSRSIGITQTAYDSGDKRLAELGMTYVVVDRESGKAAQIPDWIREPLEQATK